MYSTILNIEYNLIPFIWENSSFNHINIFDFKIYSFIIIPIIIKNVFIINKFSFPLLELFLLYKFLNNNIGKVKELKIRLLNIIKFE